jgi:hypothetical protein
MPVMTKGLVKRTRCRHAFEICPLLRHLSSRASRGICFSYLSPRRADHSVTGIVWGTYAHLTTGLSRIAAHSVIPSAARDLHLSQCRFVGHGFSRDIRTTPKTPLTARRIFRRRWSLFCSMVPIWRCGTSEAVNSRSSQLNHPSFSTGLRSSTNCQLFEPSLTLLVFVRGVFHDKQGPRYDSQGR